MILCLLTTAASPALAQRAEGDDRRGWRSERTERSDARNRDGNDRRPLRAERPQDDGQRSFTSRSEVRDQRPVRAETSGDARSPRMIVQERVGERRPALAERRPTLDGAGRRESSDSVRNWRSDRRRQQTREIAPAAPQGWARQPRADEPREGRFADRMPGRLEVSRTPREGTQPPSRIARRDGASVSSHWRGDWRNDNRYDWRRHRDRNRSIFRAGFYHDPFGWNYRRYNVGWRLWPSYYSSNYWLSEPWMYRLPPAYPGTRWIRYHGDALLVDTWTGEVVDVIYDFFW